MLMNLAELVGAYNMRVAGILHVGAHLAEEAEEYDRLGMHDVWWVEANPKVLPLIEKRIDRFPGQTLIHALVYSESRSRMGFNVTNYDGMSSSILEFGTHPEFSPDTVFVERITLPAVTIDDIVTEHRVRANFLNMDLQGAELHALRGANAFLRDVDYIMTEVNQAEVYKDCARVEQLDRQLCNFRRVETYWVPGQGWGDALYVRSGA
jgi:FkbM family methyltransferase